MRIAAIILTTFALITAAALSGCDVTAERELKRAERALNAALEVGADAYATEDYTAAEELLNEAMDLSRAERIQEARSVAIKAKLRAEDAQKKAEERRRILEQEMDELGR